MLALFCDDSSVCAKGKNNFGQGGVPDGGRFPEMEYSVTLHSDESGGNIWVKRGKPLKRET